MCFSSTAPERLVEKIYIYTGRVSDSKFYKEQYKTAASTNGKSSMEIQSEKKAKETAVAMDKLFSHIRNSFAHGCFSVVDYRNERYYILQDESNDYISARMILKKDTLQSWIACLHDRKAEISASADMEENYIEEKVAS